MYCGPTAIRLHPPRYDPHHALPTYRQALRHESKLPGWLLVLVFVTIILTPFPTAVYAPTCGNGSNITITDTGGERCRGYLTSTVTSTFLMPTDWVNGNNTVEAIGSKSGTGSGVSRYASISGDCRVDTNCLNSGKSISYIVRGGGAGTTAFANNGASTNLSATAVSRSQINLMLTAATDSVCVTRCQVFRNGTQVGTPSAISCSDTRPATLTAYTYSVSAYDTAGNNSAPTSSASAAMLAGPTVSCNVNATTGNFASQVSAAAAGQVICLASGDYGTWTGTNKAITITKQSGATVNMRIDFTTGDGGFTIDGLTIPGGRITNGADNITVKNSAFTSSLVIDGVANANILLDNNTHIDINGCESGCDPAAVHLPYSSNTFSGVTVQNSLFQGGNADGIQAGTGLNILNNRFIDISEHGNSALHTDPIQLIGAKGSVVRGNYLYNTSDGIVAYDGLDSATIEDNVIDLVHGRWGIELYADKNSIVRHNTLKYGTGCEYAVCGQILLDHKPTDPAGNGTVIENNIASGIIVSNGSTAAVNRDNMLVFGSSGFNFSGTPTYVGGANPSTYAGYALAAGSQGKSAASDGLDVGIRVSRRP